MDHFPYFGNDRYCFATFHVSDTRLTNDEHPPGLPKPIIYTNMMMTSLDAARSMPDRDAETIMDHYANSRWYTPLPSLHVQPEPLDDSSQSFVR